MSSAVFAVGVGLFALGKGELKSSNIFANCCLLSVASFIRGFIDYKSDLKKQKLDGKHKVD